MKYLGIFAIVVIAGVALFLALVLVACVDRGIRMKIVLCVVLFAALCGCGKLSPRISKERDKAVVSEKRTTATVADFFVINYDGSISSDGKVLIDSTGKMLVPLFTFDEIIATAFTRQSSTAIIEHSDKGKAP